MTIKWTSAAVYQGGNKALVFINGSPVAYFKEIGECEKPTLYIKQGMNRDEFKTNLFANLPEFCEANNITNRTIFDIFTKRELEAKATICRVNR
jgi:hypothetical protein